MSKKVNIKGPIVSSDEAWIYDWFGIENTNPKSVNKAIEEANGDELEVEINSGGGSVFAGSEIYTALRSYKGNVTVKIVGLAASAASVIAMAGKKIMMSPTAQMMIHNVSTYASGDYRDMEHASEILKNANETIANAYRIKSGMSQKELLKMMDNETWMTAEKAKGYGLIDEVMFDDGIQLVASTNYSGLLPNEVIKKMRNKLQNENAVKQATAKLNYLRLKGESHE
jgi:ATP-dependent Clp endopeptidase proteolytic subunit ClpP